LDYEIQHEYENWTFNEDHPIAEWRTLAAWEYKTPDDVNEPYTAKITVEDDEYLFVPPNQFFASDIACFDEITDAFNYANQYLEDMEVTGFE